MQKEAAFPVTAGGVFGGGRPNAMLAISDVAFGADSPRQASAPISVLQDGGQILGKPSGSQVFMMDSIFSYSVSLLL